MPNLTIDQALQVSKNKAMDLLRKTTREDLDQAGRRAHDNYNEAPIPVLDDELVGMIHRLAGGDARKAHRLERRRLAAG